MIPVAIIINEGVSTSGDLPLWRRRHAIPSAGVDRNTAAAGTLAPRRFCGHAFLGWKTVSLGFVHGQARGQLP
jgi:hypothetical protein